MDRPSPDEERFDTGGRVTGWVGVVCSAGLVVVWLASLGEPLPVPLLTGSVLAGLLFWSAIVRPAVWTRGDDLVLRNMLVTLTVPLAAVEELALRQVLAVRAGDKRYVGTGLGRSLRQTAAPRRASPSVFDVGAGSASGSASGSGRPGGRPGAEAGLEVDAADFVESRLGDLAASARERAGVARWSVEQVALAASVRREVAWPVVAALVLALAVFVASFQL